MCVSVCPGTFVCSRCCNEPKVAVDRMEILYPKDLWYVHWGGQGFHCRVLTFDPHRDGPKTSSERPEGPGGLKGLIGRDHIINHCSHILDRCGST